MFSRITRSNSKSGRKFLSAIRSKRRFETLGFVLDHDLPQLKRRKLSVGTKQTSLKKSSFKTENKTKKVPKNRNTSDFYLQDDETSEMLNRAMGMPKFAFYFTLDTAHVNEAYPSLETKSNRMNFQIINTFCIYKTRIRNGKSKKFAFMFVTCRDMKSDEVYEFSAKTLALAETVWQSRPLTEIEREAIVKKPSEHDQANERSLYFAELVAKFLDKGEYYAFLDGPGRNLWALVKSHVPTVNGIIFERRSTTAIYHRFMSMILGLKLTTIYCPDGFENLILKNQLGTKQGLPKDILKRLTCCYFDFCGNPPPEMEDCIEKMPNLKILGVTIGKRNRISDYPKLGKCIKSYDQRQVTCKFFRGKPADVRNCVYEVDKIVDHDGSIEDDQGVMFKVHWKHYPSEVDTWETHANLSWGAQDALEKYLKSNGFK